MSSFQKDQESFKPFFNSKNLNDTLNEVSEIFEFYQSDINSVSSDIRELEKYISSKNITIPFRAQYEGFSLAWGTFGPDDKKFRLLYTEMQSEDWGDPRVILDGPRPLMESPLKYRLKAYCNLSRFLHDFSKELIIYNRPKPAADEPIFDHNLEPIFEISEDLPI